MTEPSGGSTGVDWSQLSCAYGPADSVPGFLRDAASLDPGAQDNGVSELFHNVWHRGTVYSCTPHAAPFIADLVADGRLQESTRAQLALPLASSPYSFVLDGETQPFIAEALRLADDRTPSAELDQDCRRAVADSSKVLDEAFSSAPDAVRAALLALGAAIASSLTPTAHNAIVRQTRADDPLIAHAAQLVVALSLEQPLLPADLAVHAAVNAEAARYLTDISHWPTQVQAVELVRELSEYAVAARLA